MKNTMMFAFGLSAALGGCSCVGSEYGGSSRIEVSPDGQWIAYLYGEDRYISWPPDSVRAHQAVHLCWSSTRAPGKVQSVKIDEWGFDKRDDSLCGQTHFLFSPGATRIAVIYPSYLMFVGTAGGGSRRVRLEEGEWVTSLAWIDEETIVYVSYRERQTDNAVSVERALWRQHVDADMAGREAIHRDRRIDHPVPKLLDGVDGWALEFWSPDGRYVVLRGPDNRAQAHLLNVVTKDMRRLAGNGALMRASWSRDSQQILWYGWAAEKQEAFLQNVARGAPLDLSDQWQALFGRSKPYFEILWTPDNRFVPGSNLTLGGYLLSPDPWQVRLIGEKFRKPGETVSPNLRGQVVPDLLVVDLAPNEVVVDYAGRSVKELGEGGLSGWTILPGGKKAVSVGLGNDIIVKAVE